MYVGRVPMHDDLLVEQDGAAEVAGGGVGLEESGEEAGIAEHQWGESRQEVCCSRLPAPEKELLLRRRRQPAARVDGGGRSWVRLGRLFIILRSVRV